MARNHWQKLDEIFQQVWESPPEERAAVLDAACGDDQALRAEVESLLTAAGSPTGWLDGTVAPRAIDLLTADPSLPFGTEVGQYRLLELLGRGGMGAVYLAERSDGQYDQKVALKVIKRGMDTDFLLARFRRERQILAQLDHPGIAKLLDGGATEDGRPYLVMEHIEGEPIDTYVRTRHLDLEARLDLFLQVCDAVRSSHRQLVIHRDLKPSNILVTTDGQPKLLDFGTAKLLEDVSHTQTAHEVRFLTPGYGSPEQIQGGPITTAADIFGLGILLYELLTDRSPFPAEGKSYQEVAAMVCEGQPPRPSQVAPASLRMSLRGDLDAIVLCALRKEPRARFESVAALVEDIERFNQSRPVKARSGNWRYRTGRFLRRNLLAVGAAALVAVLALAFVGALITEQRKTQREKERAEAVTDYLESLFEGFNPFQGQPQPVTAREMLDRGVERVERELGDQPDLRREMLVVLASIYGDLGHRDRQREIARQGLAESAEGDDAERDRFLHLIAEAELNVGNIQEAKEPLEEATAILVSQSDPDPLEVGRNLILRAKAARLEGEMELAESLGQDAVAELRALEPRDEAALGSALLELGATLRQLRDNSAAREVIEEAVDRIRRGLGPEHPRTMGAIESLGAVLFDVGEWQPAQELMDQVIARRRETLGENHPEVIASLYNLGALAAVQGRFDTAEDLLEQALERMRAAYETDHPRMMAAAMWLSRVGYQRGRPEAARRWAAEATKVAGGLFPETQPAFISCLHLQALAERLDGQAEASRAFLERALELANQQASQVPSSHGYSHLYLAEHALQEGRLEEAEAHLESWKPWSSSHDGKMRLRGALSQVSLALHRGDVATAKDLLEAIDGDERATLELRDRLVFQNLDAAVALAEESFERAERYARRALSQAQETLGPNSLATGQLELTLGLALTAQGRTDEARQHLERAVAALPETWDRPPQGKPSAREALARLP